MKKIIAIVLFFCFCIPLYSDGMIFENPDGILSSKLNSDINDNQIYSLSESTLILLANISAGTYNSYTMSNIDTKWLYDSTDDTYLYDGTTGERLFLSE